MAIRQASVIKIKGRIGSDLVGYQMKGVSGVLVRTFDGQKISDNVKNSPNYANTRKNNSEFGAAASSAKAFYNAIPQKWRVILIPFLLAKVQRSVLSLARATDTTHSYGRRYCTGAELGDPSVGGLFSSVSKREFKEWAGTFKLDADASTATFDDAMLLAGKYAQSGEYDGLHIYVTGRYSAKVAAIGSTGDVITSNTQFDPSAASMTSVQFSNLQAPVVINDVEGWTYDSEDVDNPVIFQYMAAVPYKLINGSEVEFINDASMCAVV